MSAYFIASAGTGIGKTLVTTALCYQLRMQQKKMTALKPIISGYNADGESDTALILKSCGLPHTQKNIDRISPWRFAAPLSPHMAAEREGRSIKVDELVAYCQKSASSPTTLLIETAGGVMSPLSNHHTMLDWMGALGWPVILVSGNYLGALSHTLTALKALQTLPIAIAAIVVNESENNPVSLAETADTLETFVRGAIPVVKIPRLPRQENMWEAVPPLNEIWK